MSRIETSIAVPLCSYIILHCSHTGRSGQTPGLAGPDARTAVLRFTPERARWVADERWHPQLKGRMENGCYLLEIPYADDRELDLDILKHGPEVEVLKPESLRNRVLQQLIRAARQYEK